ncbi:DUF3349 domain-containing protein [Rudaeicoccus suwonensis]|uniref:Uncharacterized protein DUF3349 n=1 Tax=Rudaeicoccus suwonensis TaxID=657409 RepID=A0A561E1D8_9MICO|nr:DUF3349 domain-containing protein [Rudaeicoccus suwonensis]TWE09445.1 uncharacterized protein DUF3349 [Rudaeicoccus suwonensis]
MSTHLLQSITEWLRKGYPEGIPPKDFPPLLALLERSLTPDEVRSVVATVISDNPDGEITLESVSLAIEQIKDAPPIEDDINEVASRLAAAGWPLSLHTGSDDSAESDATSQDRPGVLMRVLGWLRAGYPEGIPTTDYVPILALLHRRLTDEEVKQVVRTLKAERRATLGGKGPILESDAFDLIAEITHDEPSAADLDRVRARLAKKGWPLESGRDQATSIASVAD